jgi:hypothetical protein
VVGELVRVDPQVDLEGGVGPLEADVVGGQLQRVGPVDPDPERLLAQPPQAVVEGPVAGAIPRDWSSSLARAANGRPASGARVKFDSRLNRSISSTTRGSAVSALTSWLRGRARPLSLTRHSSSSAPTVAWPLPKAGRSSSLPSATRHSSRRCSKPLVVGGVEALSLDGQAHVRRRYRPPAASRTLRTAPFRRASRPAVKAQRQLERVDRKAASRVWYATVKEG